MNRIISMILLAWLVIPMAGPYLILDMQKIMIRHQMREKIKSEIPKSELQYFRLKKVNGSFDVRWVEEGEFEVAGIMYDVVYEEEGADSVSYWCLEDSEESQISQKINLLVNKKSDNSPSHRSQRQQISTFLSTLFSQEPAGVRLFLNSCGKAIAHLFSMYKSVIIPSTVPPP